jgi:GTP cyclohydrolase-4
VTTLIGTPPRRRRPCGASSASRRLASTRPWRGLVRNAATERLLEALAEGDVGRTRARPASRPTTSAVATLLVGTESGINAERLVDVVEQSMSSPIYELLKRPDELFVVEHAHLQPRFVEDSVRHALKATLDHHPALVDG